MPNFISQTAVNLTGLDLFSGFSKISAATVSAIAGGFRIQLSATETVEVTGSFTFAGTVPIGGTVNGIQLSVSGTPIIQLFDIAVSWANAIAYSASQAAALAAWPTLLAGADTLTGSSFADTLSGYGGADTINGGAGLDTVLYTDKTTSVVVALNGATAATVTVNGVAEDILTNIENVTGGSANDTLTGDAQANVLIGGGGDDTLTGGGGLDVLDGGEGADTAVFSDKSASLVLALNGTTDAIAKIGGINEDVVRNVENIVSGSGNDTLSGDLLANLLDGGAGDDLLIGGAGKDTLDGGTGIDTVLFSDKTLGLSITLNGATNALMVMAGQVEDTLRNVENVTGGSGADFLAGDSLANILDGGIGNDTLTGGLGLDVLDGGAGIDTALYAEKTVAIEVTLNGASDTTVTVAGSAEDTIRNIENIIAGSAADTLIGDSLANLLDGGSGDDTISGGGGDDVLAGRAGLDTLDGGEGVDTANYAEKTASVTVTLKGAADTVVKIGGQDEDTLRNVENLIGGSGGDVLTGDDLANLLSGGQGNDVLDGRGGKDFLDGGLGSDTALFTDKTLAVVAALNGAADVTVTVGGAVEDTLRGIENLTGGSGNDILGGDGQANMLDGGSGDDRLTGGLGLDTLDGGIGIDTAVYSDRNTAVVVTLNGATKVAVSVGGFVEDTIANIENLIGGSAADILTGDANANVFDGGNGDDLLMGAGGLDVLDGGLGSDTVSFADKTLAVTLTLAGPLDVTSKVGGVVEDTVRNIENIIGGAGADTLTGDDLNNRLAGGIGADLLSGEAGDDGLIGGEGADTMDGGEGLDTAFFTDKMASVAVTLTGTVFATVTIGGIAEDKIRGIENLVGGDAGDSLTGDTGNNRLDGGFGADTLNGGQGDDILIGGEDADQINGGSGTDTALFTDQTQSVAVTLNGATKATVSIGGVDQDTVVSIENIVGGSGHDGLTGDDLANLLDGGAGDDLLTGGNGLDVLDGGAGSDTASYAEKTDAVVVTLTFSANATVSVGGLAEDTIRNIENVIGGSAADTLTGDVFANKLSGSGGNDTLLGAGGLDTLDGGAGIDTALYTDKAAAVLVTLNGGIDATLFVGGFSEDIVKNIENIVGGSGNDILTGDGSANILEGRSGDDLISGQGGNDTLDGGLGIDTARYSEKSTAVVVTLNGSLGTVVTVGGVAEDVIAGFENLIGGLAGDSLTGDNQVNLLDGAGGGDLLNGAAGDDRLIGRDGNDTIDGGDGIDTGSYQEKSAAVVVTLNGANDAAVSVGGAVEDIIRNVENLEGGSGADSLTGDTLSNVFLGGSGKDTLDGGGGVDTALYTDKALPIEVTLNGATPALVTIGGTVEDSLLNIENVTGGGGADRLTGDAQVNTLVGGAGDDILMGAGGQDVLDGGVGIDTVLFTDKTVGVTLALNSNLDSTAFIGGVAEDVVRGVENVTGGSGHDVLFGDGFANILDGALGNDTLAGGNGRDTLDGGGGIDTVLFIDKTISVVLTLDGANNAIASVGGFVEDTVRNVENLVGGAGADTLGGDAGVNILDGGAGDDQIAGGGGKDVIDGGIGTGDVAVYSDKTTAVVVTLNGPTSTTVTVGGVAEDTIQNIEGIVGGTAGDTLTGDALANMLDGGLGNDSLNGGEGADLLIGRAGLDTMDGQGGVDTASYADKTVSVSVTLKGASDASVSIGGVAEDILRNVENLIGGTADDTLTGDALANSFLGGAGKDVLDGAGGIDTALYTDTTLAVAVTLNGATNATVTIGGLAADTLRNIENITGGSAADTLSGDAQANTLLGGTGDDILKGAGGADIIDGEFGIDTVLFTDETLAVVLTLNGAADATATIGGLAADVVRNVENVVGGAGNDILTGDNLVNLLDGGAGDDVLNGGFGRDVMDGGTGIDTANYASQSAAVGVAVTLNGASNAIVSIGGIADDTIRNIENLIGGQGADNLVGDALANVIAGSAGKDILEGGGGIDTVVYSDQTKSVQLTLNAGTYATVSIGGVVEDTIRDFENVIGGTANDSLTGDALANMLSGGGGDDLLSGGLGDDSLDGGTGINTAVYSGALGGYTISVGADTTTVSGAEGTDTLRNIQFLQFSDGTVPVVAGAGISISALDATKAEGLGGTQGYTFTVTRAGNTTKAQSVSWAVTGLAGTGTTPATAADFVGTALPKGTVNFGIGESSKIITVGVHGDIIGENNERFAVTLSKPTNGATISKAMAEGVILNDDTSLTIVRGNADRAEGNSGATTFSFVIRRAGDLTGSTSVNWATIGDASDFAGGTLPQGSVTFAPGEIGKGISLKVAGDTLVEPDDVFSVVLYGASGNAVIATQSAQGTILADDAIPNSAGNDTLIGTFGSDLFVLTGGNDTVIGSAGVDRFQFLPGSLGGAASSTVTLQDFDRSLAEVLDLSAIDAIAGTVANDAFSFIGTASFGGNAGELRWTDTGAARLIQGDVNGDSVADLTIRASAIGPVTSDWFVF